MMMQKLLLLSFLFLSIFNLTAQTSPKRGIIKGHLIDLVSGEGLIGANVLVDGLTLGAATDVEGNYTINNVPVGTYNLTVTCISYKNTKIQNVIIEQDKVTLLNSTVESSVQALGEIVVKGTRKTNTEMALISQIKEAKMVVSGISAEQILKSQDRDAAEVVRRIPGVTIVDNRFINIRGLNERYNTVWLNDAVAPSSETDRKSFSFDIVPSNLLDRILIFKTPSAELPGDFAGGMVKVYTRKPNYTEESFNISLTAGFRQGTTFQDFTSDKSYGSDWTGFGYQDRLLPTATPDGNGVIPVAQAKTFSNNYALSKSSALPDRRVNLSYLRGFKIGEISMGSLSAISYSNTLTTFNINRLDIYRESVSNRDEQSGNNVKVSLLQNFVVSLGDGGKLEFRNMYNQSSRNQVTSRNTFDEAGVNQTKYSYAMGYQSRSTYNGQLAGFHNIKLLGGLQVEWVLGYASSVKHEPDYRRTQFNFQSQQAILPQSGVDLFTGSRLYQDLTENIYSGNLGFKQKINDKVEINFGGYVENKDRAFVARQFGYSLSAVNKNYNAVISQPIGVIFGTQNVEQGAGLRLEEDGNSIATQAGIKPNYSYDASNQLAAGYISGDFTLDKIKIVAGLRFEHNNQAILAGLNGTKIDQTITTDKLLPSINLSYNLTEKTLFRLAYGRTLNRPEFREWAPFVYYDFDVNALNYGSLYLQTGGNGTLGTLLKVADIDNFDLRYEYYPSEGENVHVGIFYKKFTNPIEASIANNPNLSFTYINAPSAFTAGIEVDIRKKLSFLNTKFFNKMSVLFNASLIKSEVAVNAQQSWTPNRKLQGQSPYVVNMGLYYQSKNWQVSTLYNVFGERIVYIGSGNLYYSEVVEMPRHTIDLTISRNISDKISVNFGISDLLNQSVLMLQDDPNKKDSVFDRNSTDPHFIDYKRGSYYTLGLKYGF